jgi:hypothetical protein
VITYPSWGFMIVQTEEVAAVRVRQGGVFERLLMCSADDLMGAVELADRQPVHGLEKPYASNSVPEPIVPVHPMNSPQTLCSEAWATGSTGTSPVSIRPPEPKCRS